MVWRYSGIRPLFDDGAKNVSKVTRDYTLRVEGDEKTAPVLSVFGGKITTYRRLAEDVLDRLAPGDRAEDRAVHMAMLCGVLERAPDATVAACGNAQGLDLPTSVAPFILRGVKLVGVNSVSTPMPRPFDEYPFPPLSPTAAVTRTVFDNAALPLELAGMDKAAIRERVNPLLELVGLSRLGHQVTYLGRVGDDACERSAPFRFGTEHVDVIDRGERHRHHPAASAGG